MKLQVFVRPQFEGHIKFKKQKILFTILKTEEQKIPHPHLSQGRVLKKADIVKHVIVFDMKKALGYKEDLLTLNICYQHASLEGELERKREERKVEAGI